MLSTPKKIVNKGPKTNDCCRICRKNFKTEFGNSNTSTENLFKPSQRKESFGVVLAESCSDIGLVFVNSPGLSQLVCRICSRKVRNAIQNYSFLKESLRKEETERVENRTQTDQTPTRSKRCLPTTITPDRTLAKKTEKSNVPFRQRASSSKKLKFGSGLQSSEPEEENPDVSPTTLEDEFKNLYHLEPESLVKKSSEVRVLIGYPSGEIKVRETFDEKTKSLLRALSLKRWKTALNVLFSHEDLMEHVPDALRRKVDSEFSCLSSDCILKGNSPSEVTAFKNKIFVHEVRVKCPLWYSAAQGACGIKGNSDLPQQNKAVNAVALSSSVLAKFRNPCMSALAYRISLILFHGGLSYRDTQRLNQLGICMSPDSLIRMEREMGESCDSKVLLWKKSMEEILPAKLLLQEIKIQQDESNSVTTPLELNEKQLESCHYHSNSTYKYCNNLLEDLKESKGDSFLNICIIDDALQKLNAMKLPRFRIVGDNIDFYIQARMQSNERQNQSVHWTQQYAILDKVNDPSFDDTHAQRKLKCVQLVELLPNSDVQKRFKRNCAVLVSRVITKYLKCFQHMSDVVLWHIEHPHSEEASKKSDICCLGLQFKNPNVAGEMAQILVTNQEKYVPCVKSGKDRLPEILMTIPLHGDQLFEERARNVQYTFQDGINKYDRLEGLSTEVADWHAKMNLYSIEFDLFVSDDSARESATSRASMNRVGKTRAAKGVKKQFNEYKEFHQNEVEAHICASFMEFMHMSSLEDTASLKMPSANSPKEERREWLLTVCEKYIDNFMGFGDITHLVEKVRGLQESQQQGYKCRSPNCQANFVYHSMRVRHEIEVHNLLMEQPNDIDQEMDSFGYYYCRIGCGHVFKTSSTRNRHEKSIHLITIDCETPTATTTKEPTKKNDDDENDYLFNYHRGKLALGLLLFEFEDTIKEGDGDRLMDVYRIALLFYRCYGHVKYAYIILLTLVNIEAALTQAQSYSLKWNRFFNKYGGKGNNIPLDLKMEQLNKLLKSLFRSLGPNLDQSNASRVANAIESLELAIQSIDEDCSLATRKGYRSKGKPDGDVLQITKDLLEKNVFKYTPQRAGHQSFPDFKSSLLSDLDYRDFHKWMTGLIKKWSSVQQN